MPPGHGGQIELAHLLTWDAHLTLNVPGRDRCPLAGHSPGNQISRPPLHRCQYIRISVIFPPAVSQKIAPRASTHSPVRRRRNVVLNSVENQGRPGVDLPGRAGDLGLVVRHVGPPPPDRRRPRDRFGKWGLAEHRVVAANTEQTRSRLAFDQPRANLSISSLADTSVSSITLTVNGEPWMVNSGGAYGDEH